MNGIFGNLFDLNRDGKLDCVCQFKSLAFGAQKVVH